MADQAEISPGELKFRFQLNKQLPAAISIHNPTGQRLAFKVKTTTPKKYVVRPSSGIVDARSTSNVQVIMQAQKELPADLAACKDKFLVQVKALDAGEDLTQDTFKAGPGVRDTKIRVLLEGPPAPPSPVPEVNELDESDSRAAGALSAGGHLDNLNNAAGAAAGDPASLSQENRALRAQLERLVVERDNLRTKLDKTSKGAGAGRSSSLGVGSLLPLLLVAVLAFLVGHFLQNLPALQQLYAAKGVSAAAHAAPVPATPTPEVHEAPDFE